MNTFVSNTEEHMEYNNLYTDYKAETVALNLMKYYQDVDEFFLSRSGKSERSFHKDIKSLSSQIQDLEQKYITIDTYRESIYDYLPEGIFHPSSLGTYRNGVSNIIFQIQKQKKIENSARRFFFPFETESFYVVLSALFVETDYDLASKTNVLLNIINELWPLLKELEAPTAKIFACMLPFFHAARGNTSWLEKCLTTFLLVPVKIDFVPNKINDIEDASNTLVLSNMELGISTILSKDHMDGERNWRIHIGNIPYAQLEHYIPSSNLRKLLQLMYNYCIPVTVKVEEDFVTEKKEDSFALKKDVNTSVLGYSTFL